MSETIRWSHVLGNPVSIKPTPEMLEAVRTEGFYIVTRNIGVKGGSKFKTTRRELTKVQYDHDYLVHYTVSRLGALLDLPYNELQGILKEARAIRKGESDDSK